MSLLELKNIVLKSTRTFCKTTLGLEQYEGVEIKKLNKSFV